MSKFCFATVTDESFAVAAQVLIHSFIKFNPWFNGDVVVVEVGTLSDQSRQRLECIYPVKFIPASSELLDKLDSLQKALPWLKNKRAHFHLFELFKLTDYDHIVYVDGDTYCNGNIQELFTSKSKLQASPDGFNLRTQLWKILGDQAPEKLATVHPYGEGISASFNSGVLALSGDLISDSTYQDLLSLLNPTLYKHSDFGDQMALNVYFKDNYEPISCRFNYMILVEEYIKGLENIISLDAKIIHFAGKIKPWYQYPREALFQLAPQYIKYIDAWQELYYECQLSFEPNNRTQTVADKVARQRQWQKENLAKIDALKNISLL